MTADPHRDDEPSPPGGDGTRHAGSGEPTPHLPDGTPLPARIAIHASKPKLLMLTLPCLLAIVVTAQADGVGHLELAEFAWFRLAAVVIALLVAAQLVRMAFEREPVLVLDAEGIHCRRPPIGVIGWNAITALGAGKATLMRRVLMVAADERRLGEQARTFASRSTGFLPLISPQLGRFGAQSRGAATFHIPTTLLAMSAADIERRIEAFALAYIPDD